MPIVQKQPDVDICLFVYTESRQIGFGGTTIFKKYIKNSKHGQHKAMFHADARKFLKGRCRP